MTEPRDFLSREELLVGLPARRASILLFAIEGRTARLVDRARRAMAPGVTERSAEARERAFLEAVAEGGELPVRPAIQDLERYAPAWAPLVPPDPAMRAAVFHAISERYVFTARVVPALRAALGVDQEAVDKAYSRLYDRPLASAFARELPLVERLRWRRAAASRWLESLPPVWTAFALTLTETVGAGVLALPIALAHVGPAVALVLLVVFGLVNIATVGAIVEAITRDGGIRYGSAYFGRLVQGYLGDAARAVLTPTLLLFTLLVLVAFYIGVARTMADVTAVPPTLWAAALFVVGVVILRRENLNATVASALAVGAANIALIMALILLALPHVEAAHLRHVNLPFAEGGEGGALGGSAVALVFGVVLAAYFGHTSAGNAAKVVLRRDASGRALMVGNVGALGVVVALNCLFVVAVNGAVEPATMAATTGTALSPLAAEVGPLVHVFGTTFVILAMGMGSVHMALGVSNQVREWLPSRPQTRTQYRERWGRLAALAGGRRFWLAMTPVAATFVVIEWLLATDRGSFAGPLSFTGTLTIPLLGGVFPMLMLVASRRKGEYVPASVARVLGHPVLVVAILVLYLGGIIAHGLWIWEAPLERAAAFLVFAGMFALIIVLVRRRVFEPHASIEVRVDQERDDAVVVEATLDGQRIDGSTELELADGHGFAALRSVTVVLPESRARTLKLRVHRVTLEHDTEPLRAAVEIRGGSEHRRLELDGPALVPIDGSSCRIRLSFPHRASAYA